MFLTLIWVFIGAGVGGALRYLVYLFCSGPVGKGLPIATMSVNIIGSLLIGIIFVLFQARFSNHAWFQPLFIVGLLGGFTTFSAFSLDAWQLVMSGHIFYAACYVVLSVVLCLFAVWLGVILGPAVERMI